MRVCVHACVHACRRMPCICMHLRMSIIHKINRNTVHPTFEASAYTEYTLVYHVTHPRTHTRPHASMQAHRQTSTCGFKCVRARCAHTRARADDKRSTHLPRCWRCACQTALRARHSSPRPQQRPPVGRPSRAPRPASDGDLLPGAGRVSQTLRHQIQRGGPGLGGEATRSATTAAPWSARATRSALAQAARRCPVCLCPSPAIFTSAVKCVLST